MKLLTILLAALLLSSCAVSKPPPWFVTQGFNLTECGPAAARNALCLADQICLPVSDVRKRNTLKSWWTLSDIASAIGYFNGTVKVRDSRLNPITISATHAHIVYVTNNHFLLITRIDGRILVADSFSGTYYDDAEQYKNKLTSHYYLLIERQKT